MKFRLYIPSDPDDGSDWNGPLRNKNGEPNDGRGENVQGNSTPPKNKTRFKVGGKNTTKKPR